VGLPVPGHPVAAVAVNKKASATFCEQKVAKKLC
jgi:hypothetical protein